MQKSSTQREIRHKLNVGSFMDEGMIVDLEPNLRKHYVGTPKPTNSKNRQMNPPPLPEISSASDIYVKKIELFKKKLKSFKNLTNDSAKKNSNQFSKPKIDTNFVRNTTLQDDSKKNKVLDLYSSQRATNVYHFDLSNDTKENYKHSEIDNKNRDLTASLNFDKIETSTPTSPLFNLDNDLASNSIIKNKKRTNAKEDKCSICNILLDTFYNIQVNERIVELQCGHMVHEECLLMELEFNMSMTEIASINLSNISDYLPTCSSCYNSNKCMPKNDLILTDLFTRLITMHINDPNTSKNESSMGGYIESQNNSTFSDISKLLETSDNNSSSDYTSHQLHNMKSFKNSLDANFSLGTDVHKHTRLNSAEVIKTKSSPHKPLNHRLHMKKPSRGSCISGTSAIITSVADENVENWCKDFDSEFLERKFLDDLINLSVQHKIEGTEDAKLVLTDDFLKSFGELKLVDKTNFSISDNEYFKGDSYCYLFAHMLIIINCETMEFSLISINFSTYVDSASTNQMILKNTKNSQYYYKLVFSSKFIKDKWTKALTNMRLKSDHTILTSTLKIDEFDHILDEDLSSMNDFETIGTLQSYVGDDGYRRLPTGVCPRFYEETINTIEFEEKPEKVILIANQSKYISSAIVPLKNIVKSLSMIGIDVIIVLCSTLTLSMDTNEIDSYELKKHDGKKQIEDIVDKMDVFEEKLMNNESELKNRKIENIIKEYGTNEKTVTIAISNTSLHKMSDVSGVRKILIEVGLDSHEKRDRKDVSDLAEWDDAMEVICGYCGLEFDESDFFSDYDSDDISSGYSEDERDKYRETRNTAHISYNSEALSNSFNVLPNSPTDIKYLYNDLSRALDQI